MSDLISRGALIEEIKSLNIVLNGKQIFSDDAKDSVLRIINEQPTAYDIDKVVEELENNSFITVKQEEVQTKRKDIQSYIAVEKEVILLNDAIEIVKQGGVGTETETIRDKEVKWNNNSSKRVPYEFIDYIEGKREIGVSDDVCEWHKVKNGNAYKCNTHAEIHDSRVLDWCKCPYCGKKIKVVE